MQVAAVVLHYNNEKLTNECVDSFKKTAPSVDVVIVDNGSREIYKRSDSIVIRRESHDCVGGMNFGFLYCLKNNYDFIVNADNDTVCLEGWLEPLLKVMEDDTVGICGPKQYTANMEVFRSVGMDITGGTLYCNYPNETIPVVWLQGSFVMIRSRMMEEIGLHDRRFTHICSDSDYCITANDRGWKVVFVAESSVIHYGSSSMNGVCETYTKDNERLIQKWFGIKFNELARNFPINIKTGEYGSSVYSTYNKKIPLFKMYEQKDYSK